MQPCNRIYYSKIYWRLNMFRAAHRSLSGAPNSICSLWFIYPCGDRPLSRLDGSSVPVTTWVYKPEAANTVWSSWWWAGCPSKHVEPSVNFGIIISVTRLHLVGYFYWFIVSLSVQFIWYSLSPIKYTVSITHFLIKYHDIWFPHIPVAENSKLLGMVNGYWHFEGN